MGAAAVFEPPTLKEELDRKAIETLEYLVRKYEANELNKEQLSIGLDTLFMTVSGLVSEDFINLITTVDKRYCQEQELKPQKLKGSW